jgi:hypothetical protein
MTQGALQDSSARGFWVSLDRRDRSLAVGYTIQDLPFGKRPILSADTDGSESRLLIDVHCLSA